MTTKTARTKTKLAINGLGRIGRIFLRLAWDNPHFEIVGLNSRSEPEVYAHLLKYDSAYGIWDKEVKCEDRKFVINGKAVPVFTSADKEQLPWQGLDVDFVVEATGKYKDPQDALKHLEAGAKHVLVTNPLDNVDITLVAAVNDQNFNASKHKIISGASCTSVCGALTIKVLEENFGIEHGFLSTVHAFTGDQSLQDSSHKDFRRARASTESIIPTTTGVTKTIDQLFPSLKGKLSGASLRVPVIVPSLLSFAVTLKKPVTTETVNQAFSQAAAGELQGHLAVSNLPLVSIDFKQNPHGAIIDLPSTQVIDGKLVNILAWYDNEWGYTSQVVKLLERLASRAN